LLCVVAGQNAILGVIDLLPELSHDFTDRLGQPLDQ
jgi:hypothetical protein